MRFKPFWVPCMVALSWVVLFGSAWGAPTLEWSSRYDGPVGGADEPAAVAVDASGNVFVAGTTSRPGGKTGYATLKYDADGRLQWLKRSGAAQSATAAALALDASGNALVTGESEGEVLTVKYDGEGKELWSRRYRSGTGHVDAARAIAVSSDGSVFVAGDSIPPGGTSDFLIVKYDAEGALLWANRYDGPAGNSDEVKALAVNDLGNAAVAGRSRNSNGNFELTTVKYDQFGDEFWVDRYAGKEDGLDEALAMVVDADRNVFVAGGSAGENGTDAVVIKLNGYGVREWVERFDGRTHGDDRATGIALGPLGEIYICGWFHNAAKGSGDLTTLGLDSRGHRLWINRCRGATGGENHSAAVAVDGFGKVVVTGSAGVGDAAGVAFMTQKIDTDGETLWIRRFAPGEGSRSCPAGLALDAATGIVVTGSSQRRGASAEYLTVKYGQAPLWEKSLIDQGYAGEPRVAVTSAGTPHVCYPVHGAGDGRILRHVFHDGAGWRQVADVPSSEGVEEFEMVMDSLDRLHVVFGSEEYLRYALFDGAQWTVTTLQAGAITPSIAIDSNNRPHIVFEDLTEGSPYPTVYARYDGTQWQRDVMEDRSYRLMTESGPPLAINRSGSAHLLVTRLPGSRELLWGTNESGSWVFSSIVEAHSAGLALGADDQPHVFSCDSTVDRCQYSKYTGSTWITGDVVCALPSDGTMESMRFLLDSSGIPHVTLAFYTDHLIRLVQAQMAGTDWTYDYLDTKVYRGFPASHGKDLFVVYRQRVNDASYEYKINCAWSKR